MAFIYALLPTEEVSTEATTWTQHWYVVQHRGNYMDTALVRRTAQRQLHGHSIGIDGEKKS